MKKISVIIPVYNAEKWLERLIESIKSQTIFCDLEFIFVNDGSTDNSLKILNKVNEPNIKIISQENGGVSAARNNGIKNASGDYIAFIDADDYIDNDFFEKYLENKKDEYDLIVTGYIAEYENKSTVVKNNQEKVLSNKTEIIKMYLEGKIDPNCWNKLFKKKYLLNSLFDEKMAIGEDKDMLFRYLNQCNSVYINNYAKYHYYINNTSAMRKKFNVKTLDAIKKSEERVEYIKKNYPELYEYAYSGDIDTKCRILCSLYSFKENKNYEELCKNLKKEIKAYSILRKKKNSTKKHFLAFLAVRINPRLYVFLKEKMKLQYK